MLLFLMLRSILNAHQSRTAKYIWCHIFFFFVEKVTVLFSSAYTPEGREKYVLALHEYVSSTSLSMAFTAAPVPKSSLVPRNVAQHG